MKKTNIKTPIVFRISLVLLCMLLITSYMMGGLYAKYATSATGTDGTRVARFSFKDTLPQSLDVAVSLSPGEVEPYTFILENDGEVTVRYVVKIVNLTDNLPIYDQTITSVEVKCGETKTFEWKVEWPKDENSISFMGKMDVLRIVVNVEQVD